MAAPAHSCSQPSYLPSASSIKELSCSATLSSLPPFFVSRNPDDEYTEPVVEAEVPIVDFDLLVRGTPDQRSQAIRELGKACEDWGFFMVVNHGISESLKEGTADAMAQVFDLTAEEKAVYMGGRAMDPIRMGTSFSSLDDVGYWRDYVKFFVHPEFHPPSKPHIFRDVSKEYSVRMRALSMELLEGIWESLGVEQSHDVTERLNLSSCFQILVGNLYPPCPQPELAMGMPPHSDHGLLTFLFQNGVDGLQVKHAGRWVHAKPLPGSFLVNTGDQMEILSNGRYRSVLHRAVLNGERTRMSVGTLVGPALDAVIKPIPELVSSDSPARFQGVRYRDYIEHQQSNRLVEKTALDRLRLHAG